MVNVTLLPPRIGAWWLLRVLIAQSSPAKHWLNFVSHYWMPLYTYARRQGHPVEDAEDLVQGFLICLLESDLLERAEQKRGKFRTYLLTCFNHYRANEWNMQRAQKRGRGHVPISLDLSGAEGRLIFRNLRIPRPRISFMRSNGH